MEDMGDGSQLQNEQPRENSPSLVTQDNNVLIADQINDIGGVLHGIKQELLEAALQEPTPDLEAIIREQNEEISQLKSEVDLAWERNTGLWSKYINLVKQQDDAEQEVEDLKNRMSTLQEDNTNLSQFQLSYQRLRDQTKNLRAHYSESEQEVQSLEAKARTLRKDLEACKDDLFRLQPAAQTPDTEIISDFESLAQHIHNWIEVEINDYEKLCPKAVSKDFFSSGGNEHVTMILQRLPDVGEYLVRYEIYRFLQEIMLGSDTYLLGLPDDIMDTIKRLEDGMAKLKPSRDTLTIKAWRSEALRAFAATPEFSKNKNLFVSKINTQLFKSLSRIFPVIRKHQANSKKRLHEQISVPAASLAIKIQLSASTYIFKPKLPKDPFKDFPKPVPFKKDCFPKSTLIDIKTRKILKADSGVAVGASDSVGNVLMRLEPCLERSDEGRDALKLREAIYLVDLNESSNKRKRGSVGRPKGS